MLLLLGGGLYLVVMALYLLVMIALAVAAIVFALWVVGQILE